MPTLNAVLWLSVEAVIYMVAVQVCATTQDRVNIVALWGADGPDIPLQRRTNLIDCSVFGPWNLTINMTALYVQQSQSFATYQSVLHLLQGSQHYTFFESSVTESPVVDAVLNEGRSFFDPQTFLVLKSEEHLPVTWCCHVAKNASVTTELRPERESSQMDFYSYLISDFKSAKKLDSSPCPSDAALTANGLDEWRQAKERQAKILLDITTRLEWDNFLILYQNKFEQQVRLLTQLASKAKAKVLLADVEMTKMTQAIMLRYFETSPNLNVVLITSASKAEKVLQMAKALEPKIGKRISVTSLSRWLFFCQEGVIYPDTWMFSSLFDNIALVSDASHLGPGHPLQFERETMFVLTTLLYKTGRRELASVGSVDFDWMLQLQQDVFPNIKFGFNGRLFIVTTLSWTPYVYRHEGPDGNVTFSGFCMDMADELSRTLNFTIEWTEPPDGYWGIDEGNGSWNGLVGQVARQDVDMVIAPIGITEAREAVIDFTAPFFYDDSAVILRKPDPNAAKWRTYIDIFSQEVLWCVFIALLVAFAVLSLLVWAEMMLYRSGQKVFANSYFGSFLYLFGAMLAQGGRNLPKSAAGRIFLSSWWLFCIVVAGTYSGNLIAVLTVSKDRPPFNTLKEMAAQNDYTFGTLPNSMWTELFKTSPRPEFQSIGKRIIKFARDDPDVLHKSTAVHLEKVKRGGYAYIADKGLFSSWLATNCDLILLKEKFFPSRYAIVLPNNSVYTKVFSDQVVKFYESGLLQVWVKKWWPQQTFCQGSLVNGARALSLVDMQSSFYVLAIGVALSALVLLCESAFSLLTQLMCHSRWSGSRDQSGKANKVIENKKPEKPVKTGLRLRRF